MPDENKILTALGLDTSQFESGVNRAANRVSVLTGALNSVDKELRRIPLVGAIYEISFGKIVDGFVQIREQGRDFSRTMRTEVAGGLDETLAKIDDITEQLKNLKTSDWSRSIADFFKDAFDSKGRSVLEMTQLGGQQFKGASATRDKQSNILEKERADLIAKVVAAHEQDARARSTAYSQSILETDQARIQQEYSTQLAKIQKEREAHGGPGQENKAVIANLENEKRLITAVRDAEIESAKRRASERTLQNSASVAASYEAAAGNARSAAATQLRIAKERYEIERNGTKEESEAALAAVNVAQNQVHSAQIEYEFAKRQSDIETELIDLQVRGQTRAANQAKIRADFSTRIAEEERRGNQALADNIKLQQKAAVLAEEIREYELGGTGRARERQEERRKAQVARIAQSRLDQRERAQTQRDQGGLISGGLQSGGLRSGTLNHAIRTKDKPDTRSKDEKFQNTVKDLMGKIVSELSG